MATESTTDYVNDYDMYSPELAHRWDEVVEDLHSSGCPVSRSTIGEGYWITNTHASSTRIAADPERFTSGSGFMPNRPEDLPRIYPSEADTPIHETVRAAIDGWFRPKAVAAYEDDVRRIAAELIDRVREAGRDGAAVDLVRDFCNPLPGRVFCEAVLQMEVADLAELQHALEGSLLGSPEEKGASMTRAFVEMDRYLQERRDGERREDFVQDVLDVEFDGITWTDRVGILANVTLGGVGTTGFVLAAALQYLARHPEAREHLRADPKHIGPAVEEFLRFYAASPHNGRRVMEDTEIDGVLMKQGDYVVMSFGAASRDPAVFECPHQVDLERRGANRHMAFGAGVHRCPGSQLARLQLRIGLAAFLEAFPDFAVDDDFSAEYEIGNTRAIKGLPVRIDR